MDRATKIAFLRRKTELVAENACNEGMEAFVRKWFSKMLNHQARFPEAPASALKDIDRELERIIEGHRLAVDHRDLRAALVKEFGVSRLTSSSRAVVARVLKRGSIGSEEEYYQVQEVLACVDNIDKLGEEAYGRLDELAHEFVPPEESDEPVGPKKSGTRLSEPEAPEPRTPRWPMVPSEGDERICPPGTSLAVMESFLRLKLARLAALAPDPDDATALELTLYWGLKLVDAPSTPATGKDYAMRFRDHEIECSSGTYVSLEQLRSIEEELDAKFGFRRLLPTPRRMALDMIAAGERRTGWDNLIIERALTNYTAPPIFTREEARQLKALLKPNGSRRG